MYTRFRNYVCLLLCLIVVVALQSPVFAVQKEVVKWSELNDHLVDKSVFIESMPVIDCPVGINCESAEHLVCQVIENTFYKWKEYEFFNGEGEIRLAIEMIKPEARLLTATEAQVLLNGSKLWERQTFGPLTNFSERHSPAEHPKTKYPTSRIQRNYQEAMTLEVAVDGPKEPKVKAAPRVTSVIEVDDELVMRESVQGAVDDRERVTSFTTITNYPWNTICYLDFLVAGMSYSGTGVMISPGCVLTCAHNVWDQDLQVWSSSMTVTPAQYQDYQGGSIYEPFGTVSDTSLASNTIYVDSSGGFEYDYGVVKLNQGFPGISTFMPIEYDATPGAVNIAGYPAAVQNESNSYDMWHDFDEVIGYEGTSNRIMLHRVDTSAGQSGSPVWRYNESLGSRRLVAIQVYGSAQGNGACRLVTTIEPIISGWMAHEPLTSLDYTHSTYVPYFSTSSTRWTGLALANYNNQRNSAKVEYYDSYGNLLGSELKSFAAYGQEAFLTATADGTQGWIKISSTAPLKGLALIGDYSTETMYDMDFKTSLYQKFLFPHLAADNDWRSFAMLCNPNNVQASISYSYYRADGTLVDRVPTIIPANGSVQDSVFTLFQQSLVGGTMVVESSQPVTAFLLYDNKSITTWKAGLSAVPIE